VGEKLNFAQISALVLDGDRYSSGIISQILRGFGLTHQTVVETVEEARRQLTGAAYHLLITESNLADGALSDFIAWIRRSANPELRYIPIIVLTGYTQFSRVTLARDAGVNSVVRKPVSPLVLFDHIAWSARTDRPFIDADGYAGPCRRFHFDDPSPGHSRRMSDHPGDEPLTHDFAGGLAVDARAVP
jgi:CheY-like chemotaxis protein